MSWLGRLKRKRYKNIFFVLPGGGTKGAWQWGAIRYLKEAGIEADQVFGISVGSLNSIFVGTRNYEMGDYVWSTIRQQDIFTGSPYLRFLTLKPSLYNCRPLYKLITKYARIADFKIPTHVLAVSLKTGEPRSFSNDDPNFHKAMWASSALPVIFEPVYFDGQYWVDGGIRDFSPMRWATQREIKPDLVVIISSNPDNGDSYRKLPTRIDFKELVRYFFPNLMQFVMERDMKRFEYWNNMIEQIQNQDARVTLHDPDTGAEMKQYDVLKIFPDDELGEFLDFSRDHLNHMIESGFECARDRLRDSELDITIDEGIEYEGITNGRPKDLGPVR